MSPIRLHCRLHIGLFLLSMVSIHAATSAEETAIPRDTSKTQVVADYSNIVTSTSDDPHQSGYAVTVYRRADGLLFGDFTYAPGTTEGVGGKLSELHFASGQLSFRARTASAYDGRHSRPTRELFDFKGQVHGNALIGTLTVWDGYDLAKPQSVQPLRMKRVKTAMPLSFEVHQQIFQKEAW